MDGHLVAAVLGAQLLKLPGQRRVVQRFAGRVMFQQRHLNHRRAAVDRDQLADFARALHVHAQLFDFAWRAVVVRRDHLTTVQTVLGHRRPAHVRRPQRFHERAIHALQREHVIVDHTQRFQIARVVDVALACLHRNAH
ncbi:hypothetical protein D3C87_1468340 [compost metagenome]